MRRFDCVLGLGLAAFLLVPTALQARSPLPFITTAAILPLQVEGYLEEIEIKQDLKELETLFETALKASHRFRFLNQNLVQELWETPAGRAELHKDFEVHAFVGLTVAVSEDAYVLTARLLSPALAPYAVEVGRILRSEWSAPQAGVESAGRVKDLAFRLVNRLPVDVLVTSVQGSYVTLSGGARQGLKKGEVFTVVHPRVSEVHPLDGSWLKYNLKESGRVKLIEVSPRGAVGQIVQAYGDRSIIPGDGIKVKDSPSRRPFVEAAAAQAGEPSEVSRTLSLGQGVAGEEEEEELPETRIVIKPVEGATSAEPKPEQPVQRQVAVAHDEDLAEEETLTVQNPFSRGLDKVFKLLDNFDYREVSPGLRLWNVKGSAASRGILPLWFFNHARVLARRPWTEALDFEGFLSLDLGQSEGGLNTGFGFGGRVIADIYDFPPYGSLYGSVDLDYDSRTMRKDTFGGYDLISLGGRVGMHGDSYAFSSPFRWHLGLKLWILGSGKAGIKGKKSAVKAASGRMLEMGIQSLSQESTRSFGLGLELRDRSIKTAKGSVVMQERVFLLKLIERF